MPVPRSRSKTRLPTTPAPKPQVRRLQASLARRERELEILAEVAARIHGEGEPEAILDIVLEAIVSRMELLAAWVFMAASPRAPLALVASRGIRTEKILDQRDVEDCPCLDENEGAPRVLPRTRACPRKEALVGSAVAHACIPLPLEGGRRGVLNVAARSGEPFSEKQLRFLETLGHHISVAVERSHHRAAEQERREEVRAMAVITKAIGGSLDVDAVLRAVGETAEDILGVDRVHIFLGSDPRQLRVAHLSGLPHPELVQGQDLDVLKVGANLHRLAIEGRATLRVDDWETDPRVNKEVAQRWGTASAIVAPLLARQRLIGLLVLTRTDSHHWTDEQADLAETLAAQASVAITNARAYAQLMEAQKRLIQNERMAVVGTFASGLAHEVRNPLNSMGLQVSLLERRLAKLPAGTDEHLREQMQELTAIIREEIRRLDALVGDFLLFTRTNRLSFRSTSVDDLLDEIIRLLRPEARASGVTFRRLRPDMPLPKLPMDAEKMKQVFINLFRNAIEAMPDGGQVTVESREDAGQACLTVRDSGPGLPSDIDIYQLFVSTKPGGTGLGLSIAQQIVLDHGGTITAESPEAGGAVFTVRLPLTLSGEPAVAV